MGVVEQKFPVVHRAEKTEADEGVIHETGQRRQDFKIPRKPLSLERVQTSPLTLITS